MEHPGPQSREHVEGCNPTVTLHTYDKSMTPNPILTALALRYKGNALAVNIISVRIIIVNINADKLLTQMEKAVLEELANGFCPKMITTNKSVEVCTVRTHIHHLHEKTHTHDLPELFSHAWKNKWFDVDGYKREK
ncbi:hypothetical protein LBMAG27_15380 [Bacteroidota bacterium]|nr:hypothetical protein LBMAG27_15380 [Bacteroidota bacterium]